MEIPKKIFYDVENKTLRDNTGEEITTQELFPSATLGQKFWINLLLKTTMILLIRR